MAGFNNLGNGLGYIYVTDIPVSRIVGVEDNTLQGLRNMRRHGIINAPLAANKSAVATIVVTGAAAAGNLTAILISGVNQIAGNVPCASSDVTVVAGTWAAAINAFTPLTGLNYTASALADTVYIFEPETAGGQSNGLLPTISTSVPTLTSTASIFVGGSSGKGVYDDVTGFRYWLDANFGASGISGSTPASRNPSLPFAFAIEVTQYLSNRGLQSGAQVENKVVNSAAITSISRYACIMAVNVDTQGATATDTLEYINPTGFLEGDIVIVRGVDPARQTTLVSVPNATETTTPNLYLNTNAPYAVGDTAAAAFLQFKNDPVLGAIFTEIGRSGGTPLLVAKTIYVNSLGDDATGLRGRQDKPFATINAAIGALQTNGDIIISREGGIINAVNPVGVTSLNLFIEGTDSDFIRFTLNDSSLFRIKCNSSVIFNYILPDAVNISVEAPALVFQSQTIFTSSFITASGDIGCNNTIIIDTGGYLKCNGQFSVSGNLTIDASGGTIIAGTVAATDISIEQTQVTYNSGLTSCNSFNLAGTPFNPNENRYYGDIITKAVNLIGATKVYFTGKLVYDTNGAALQTELIQSNNSSFRFLNNLIRSTGLTANRDINFIGVGNECIIENCRIESDATVAVFQGTTATQSVKNISLYTNATTVFGANTANAAIGGNVVIANAGIL